MTLMIYLRTISITINIQTMFYSKKIKNLEDRIEVLEVMVKELSERVSNYCQEVDRLFALHQTQNPSPKPAKPRHRPRRNNGKETSAATE